MEVFKNKIEKEIELLNDIILNTTWNKTNHDVLLKNIELLKKYKSALQLIKQFKRNLI